MPRHGHEWDRCSRGPRGRHFRPNKVLVPGAVRNHHDFIEHLRSGRPSRWNGSVDISRPDRVHRRQRIGGLRHLRGLRRCGPGNRGGLKLATLWKARARPDDPCFSAHPRHDVRRRGACGAGCPRRPGARAAFNHAAARHGRNVIAGWPPRSSPDAAHRASRWRACRWAGFVAMEMLGTRPPGGSAPPRLLRHQPAGRTGARSRPAARPRWRAPCRAT